MSRPAVAVGGTVALALLLAACSSTASQSSPQQPAPTTSSSSAAPSTGTTTGSAGASVSLGSTPLGKVLVDEQGFTLYLFAADTATTSACTGLCASSWPPAMVSGTPVAGAGLTSSLLTTLPRADGTKQLEYNGHPLYTYAGDSGTGQTNGEGNTSFGAGWYVLGASGNKM